MIYVSFKLCILFIHLTQCVKQTESLRQAFWFDTMWEFTLYEALLSTL